LDLIAKYWISIRNIPVPVPFKDPFIVDQPEDFLLRLTL